ELDSPQVRTAIARLSEQIVRQVTIEPLLPFIERKLKEYIKGVNTAGLLQGLIDRALAEQYEEKAFDFLLQKVGQW
ncbi:hypothetical protein, partial [Acinetobacter baumannii]|uniref:hypothetical protein n=1 Tax=Acinetobacter baumannii TaxID=470 RepID=UPI000AFFF7CE